MHLFALSIVPAAKSCLANRRKRRLSLNENPQREQARGQSNDSNAKRVLKRSYSLACFSPLYFSESSVLRAYILNQHLGFGEHLFIHWVILCELPSVLHIWNVLRLIRGNSVMC